jgi:hypothetical protein
MANSLRQVFYIFFFLTTIKSYCQLQIKWSSIIEGRQTDAQFIIGNSKNKTLVLNKKSGFFMENDKWYIDTFIDSTLQKSKSNELNFIDKDEQFEESMALASNNFVITSSYKNKNYSLNAYNINEDGIVKDAKRELSKIQNCNSKIEYKFNFIKSLDSTKLCIFHNLPKSENDEKIIKIEQFDFNLFLEYSQTILLPYQGRESIVLDAISNNDQIALLVKVADDDKLRIFTNRTYTYYIINCNLKDGNKETIALGLKKRSNLLGSSFFVAKNNKIGICGFYRLQTDNNDNLIKPFISQFTELNTTKNIEDYNDDYAQPKISLNIIKDTNPYEYKPLQCYVLSNDNVRLICEKEFTETSCLTDFRSGMQRCNYYFHNDNIECYEFEANQESKKCFTIEKKQISINDDGYFLGSASSYLGSDLYLIYNDSKMNSNVVFKSSLADKTEEAHYMNSAKKANVVLAKVDVNGVISKQVLFSNANSKTVFVPFKTVISNTGKIIFYCKRNNKYRIGIAQLKI